MNIASSVWVNLQCSVETISRIWGKDFCPLVVALLYRVHEKDTTSPQAVYSRLYSRGVPLSHVTWHLLIHGSAHTGSNSSSILHIASTVASMLRHEYTHFHQIAVYRCKHICCVAFSSDTDTSILLLHLYHNSCPRNAYWHTASFYFILLLSLLCHRSSVICKSIQYQLCAVTLWRL